MRADHEADIREQMRERDAAAAASVAENRVELVLATPSGREAT
jgi:hypothetical protein